MKKETTIMNNGKEKKAIKNKKAMPTFLSSYFSFYRENLKKYTLIIFIASLLIFFLSISTMIKQLDNASTDSIINGIEQQISSKDLLGQNIFLASLKEKIPLCFALVIAGIAPYIPITFIGLLYPFILATTLSIAFTNVAFSGGVVWMAIGSIIQILGLSIAMAGGFYYCKISTKRFRFNTLNEGFQFSDIKREYYTIKKEEKKLKELEEKVASKKEKNKQLNVKVPYKNLLITFIISSIITVLGTFIFVL